MSRAEAQEDSSPFEDRLLSGWGCAPPTRASVAVPSTAEEAAYLYSRAKGRPVIARGLGRSYGDAAQCAGGVVVDFTAETQVLDFDSQSGTFRAEAGVSIDHLLRMSVPEGWFVPVTPGTRFVTLGGALAADVHGKNHHRDGSFASFVRDIKLAAPAGVFDLQPGDEEDLFWATAGGMGLTGVMLEMTVQLIPIETSAIVVDTERAANLDDCMERMESRDAEYRYSVAWVDCLARGPHLGRSVITRGNHATRSAIEEKGAINQSRPASSSAVWATDPLHFGPRQIAAIPLTPPVRLLSRQSVRAFNEAWFRKAPKERRGEVQSIPAFFHPLDGVGNWNRLYGPLGFTQYQCVVPFGAEDTLRYVMEKLSEAQVPTFLAVLKRFGDGDSGHLSFPARGWTLAVDMPLGLPELGELLDDFDEKVATCNGRIYLAKDGRVRPEVLHAMYPRLSEWRQICDKVDPERQLESDLSRRLHLRGGTIAR